MTNSTHARRFTRSIWDLALTLNAVVIFGGTLAFVAALASQGADFLNLPAWMWSFAAGMSVGAACLHLVACKMGDTSAVKVTAKYCGLLLALLPLALAATGISSDLNDGYGPWIQIQVALGHLAAWLSLVIAPSVAFIANGVIVHTLQRRVSSNN